MIGLQIQCYDVGHYDLYLYITLVWEDTPFPRVIAHRVFCSHHACFGASELLTIQTHILHYWPAPMNILASLDSSFTRLMTSMHFV